MEKETTTIRIPREIMEDMRKEAESIGLSVNSYMLVAIAYGRKLLNAAPSLRIDIPE